jgi:ABC-type bacteriocin/lantibiotic exporter with double-glycine peptidase domain
MFCNAIAWGRVKLPRQRRIVQLAMAVGLIYFLHGGLWMLQSTPATALGQAQGGTQIMQSQDYSCVPAACATALNRIGISSSEAEMARLTETRVGNGATTIRALDGLNQRLRGTDMRATLLNVPPDDLQHMPLPLLTSLQFEQSRAHMVVIIRVDRKGVTIIDPAEGVMWMSHAHMATVYRGGVIAFERATDSSRE